MVEDLRPILIEAGQREYNVSLPYRAVGEGTSSEFLSQIAASRDLTETKTMMGPARTEPI